MSDNSTHQLIDRIQSLFDVKTLMLGGGGVMNWSFIQAGMCDEVSILMAPVADGDADTQSLFETSGLIASNRPVGFALEHVEVMGDNNVWLRYRIRKDSDTDT